VRGVFDCGVELAGEELAGEAGVHCCGGVGEGWGLRLQELRNVRKAGKGVIVRGVWIDALLEEDHDGEGRGSEGVICAFFLIGML